MKALLTYAFKAAVLLLAAQFGSLFADNITEMRRLETLRNRAAREVQKLRRQNQHLVAEARALQSDPFFVELTLRRKLRWKHPGEIQPYSPTGARLCIAHSKRGTVPSRRQHTADASRRSEQVALASPGPPSSR